MNARYIIYLFGAILVTGCGSELSINGDLKNVLRACSNSYSGSARVHSTNCSPKGGMYQCNIRIVRTTIGGQNIQTVRTEIPFTSPTSGLIVDFVGQVSQTDMNRFGQSSVLIASRVNFRE